MLTPLFQTSCTLLVHVLVFFLICVYVSVCVHQVNKLGCMCWKQNVGKILKGRRQEVCTYPVVLPMINDSKYAFCCGIHGGGGSGVNHRMLEVLLEGLCIHLAG